MRRNHPVPKPPYSKDVGRWRVIPCNSTQTLRWRDGRVTSDVWFPPSLAQYQSHRLFYTSESTKPWPKGYPERWTSFNRDTLEISEDRADGSITWTPGPQWVDVLTRRIDFSGSYAYAFGPPFLDLPDRPWANRDVLDNKIRNKLNSEFQALVALAELKKTVSGVQERLNKIGKALVHLGMHRKNAARRALGYPPLKKLSREQIALLDKTVDPSMKGLAKDFLELQYGWRPLIKSIYDGIEHAKSDGFSQFIRAQVKSRDNFSRKITKATNFDGALATVNVERDFYHRLEYIFEITVTDTYLARLRQVGLQNPALAAWELVPWSFVVDWFLPIGDFLAACPRIIGFEPKPGLYIETWYERRSAKAYCFPASPSDAVTGTGELTELFSNKTRSIQPFPQVRLPVFKNPISTQHCANALALVVSKLRGR